jgi:hypothetical protein
LSENLKDLMKNFNIEKKFRKEKEIDLEIENNNNNYLYNNEHEKEVDIKSNLSLIPISDNKNEYNSNLYNNFGNHYPKNLPFIILDLRIYLEIKKKIYDDKPGFLPMSVIVEQEEIKDEYVN